MNKAKIAMALSKKKRDLDLEPVPSKGNLFSNEELSESPFEQDMSDEQELEESGFLPDSEMDNSHGSDEGQAKDNILESIMRKVRSRNMGK